MSYLLKNVKMRTNNTKEGMVKISELHSDIQSGKLPMLEDGVELLVIYTNYESDYEGDYDYVIKARNKSYIKDLYYSLGKKTNYILINGSGSTPAESIGDVWQQIWESKDFVRSYEKDYEYTEFNKEENKYITTIALSID